MPNEKKTTAAQSEYESRFITRLIEDAARDIREMRAARDLAQINYECQRRNTEAFAKEQRLLIAALKKIRDMDHGPDRASHSRLLVVMKQIARKALADVSE